jgi:hypothetical protein
MLPDPLFYKLVLVVLGWSAACTITMSDKPRQWMALNVCVFICYRISGPIGKPYGLTL